MAEDDKRPDLAALDKKLKAARLKQERPGGRSSKASGSVSGIGVGLRIAVDFVAGIAVGFGIGLYLDVQFETKPLFLIVFSILGFAAGLLNVIRTARVIEEREKREKREREAEENASG